MPKAKPKNRPETVPTLPGISSCAKTRMAENADAMTKPMITVNTVVQARSRCGSASVNGATPRIEPQITRLRPMRSPIGPPSSEPAATANRKTKRCICAASMLVWKRSIR